MRIYEAVKHSTSQHPRVLAHRFYKLYYRSRASQSYFPMQIPITSWKFVLKLQQAGVINKIRGVFVTCISPNCCYQCFSGCWRKTLQSEREKTKQEIVKDPYFETVRWDSLYALDLPPSSALRLSPNLGLASWLNTKPGAEGDLCSWFADARTLMLSCGGADKAIGSGISSSQSCVSIAANAEATCSSSLANCGFARSGSSWVAALVPWPWKQET